MTTILHEEVEAILITVLDLCWLESAGVSSNSQEPPE